MKTKLLKYVGVPAATLLASLATLLLPTPASAIGLRECTEQCYVHECGEMGVRCPRVTQKQMYRRQCRSHCEERVRKERLAEEEARQVREFNRRLMLERERADRHKQLVVMRHRMWMEKKSLVHRLRMEHQQAKARGQAAQARVIFQRMQLAHDQQMQYMREKLSMKENFYLARKRMQHAQHMEARRQVVNLQKELIAARTKQDQARVAQLMGMMRMRHRQIMQTRRQEAQLHVRYYETRVDRRKEHLKAIHVQKNRVQKEQVEAKQTNNKQKLQELAQRLGQLAGQQASISRQADLDNIKLQQARVALQKTSSTTSVN